MPSYLSPASVLQNRPNLSPLRSSWFLQLPEHCRPLIWVLAVASSLDSLSSGDPCKFRVLKAQVWSYHPLFSHRVCFPVTDHEAVRLLDLSLRLSIMSLTSASHLYYTLSCRQVIQVIILYEAFPASESFFCVPISEMCFSPAHDFTSPPLKILPVQDPCSPFTFFLKCPMAPQLHSSP